MSKFPHQSPDVLVAGGGAIGVAAAYELARRGADVVVVEAREAAGSECSYGNAGLVSPSHCIPLAAPGLLHVCVSERAFEALREDAELLRREGFEPQVLGPEEARELEPALRPDIAGAVFWAEDAHCEPGRFVTELARAAERAGARFELG